MTQNLNNGATGLLDDLPRGVTGRNLDEHHLPMAAWTNPEEIAQSERLRHRPGKLLLGSVGGQLVGIEDNRHVLLCAGSRSGKGVSSLIPNSLLGIGGSAIFTDPKGELASIVGEYLAETLGQKLMILDPFERTSPGVHKYRAAFNPLSVKRNLLFTQQIFFSAGLLCLRVLKANEQHQRQ